MSVTDAVAGSYTRRRRRVSVKKRPHGSIYLLLTHDAIRQSRTILHGSPSPAGSVASLLSSFCTSTRWHKIYAIVHQLYPCDQSSLHPLTQGQPNSFSVSKSAWKRMFAPGSISRYRLLTTLPYLSKSPPQPRTRRCELGAKWTAAPISLISFDDSKICEEKRRKRSATRQG